MFTHFVLFCVQSKFNIKISTNIPRQWITMKEIDRKKEDEKGTEENALSIKDFIYDSILFLTF